MWPTGTLDDWPFTRDGDRITGPGVFDMKAGLVQAVWALRALDALGLPRPACTLLLNGDEETGSLASSEVIAAEARTSRAALVFEASADGALKTARKGVGLFRLTVTGEEAHAGLDPDAGASAVAELAHQVLRLHDLKDRDAGTSVNVGVVHGGTRPNVTAGRASADLDVRVASAAERSRITAALSGPRPVDPRTTLAVTGDWNRPVFARTPRSPRCSRWPARAPSRSAWTCGRPPSAAPATATSRRRRAPRCSTDSARWARERTPGRVRPGLGDARTRRAGGRTARRLRHRLTGRRGEGPYSGGARPRRRL
ncbi:M20/M25/M40 family metallo-hydrolase [Streptomyces sp. M19]